MISIAKKEKKIIWEFYNGKFIEAPSALAQLQRHELNALVLLSIQTPIDLCNFLRMGFKSMEQLINSPSYKYFKIKKKKGGEREIHAPNQSLKLVQKHLNYYLQAYYLCIKPKEVHGFTINSYHEGKSCNIVENAKAHVGKAHILNIDLQDFFPSISAKRVKEVFTSPLFEYNEQIANALTLLLTYQGKLPIGAPSSPVISNFICFKLDNDLSNFCETHSFAYSRYADDLTFSSNSLISNEQLQAIIKLIQKNNFTINKKKLRFSCNNKRQTVTGLTVNEKVNVNRVLLKKIRAMLHDLNKNGIEMASKKHFHISGSITPELQTKFINRLGGYINFVGQVKGREDEVFKGLQSKLDKRS